MAFSAVGIRIRLFVFALLALVSVLGIMLCACCSSASSLEIRTRFFFASRLPCGQPYKFRFEANPIWHSAIKFTKSHSAKCSLHKWAQHQSTARLNCTNLTYFRLTAGRFCGNSCIVMLWVACELLLFACNTIGRHGRAFVDHTHTHSMNSLRWQPH